MHGQGNKIWDPGGGRGQACPTGNANHLLNVLPGEGGAFCGRPDDLITWLQQRARRRSVDRSTDSFVPASFAR